MMAFAWACLVGAAAPLGVVFLTLMSPPALAGPLLFLSGLSLAAVALGFVTCGLAFWMRRSLLPLALAAALLIPGALSVTLIGEALAGLAYTADLKTCLQAERDGQPIRRGERGYERRRDQDGDGLACEPVLGPQCYEGRCAPFG